MPSHADSRSQPRLSGRPGDVVIEAQQVLRGVQNICVDLCSGVGGASLGELLSHAAGFCKLFNLERSRDRLKLRPQLLGGVRMAGLERLLARYPHPDAAAITRACSFAAFRRAPGAGSGRKR